MPKLNPNEKPQASTANATRTSGVDLSRFLLPARQLGLRGDIAIHAPPAYGKTFLAASVSRHWPRPVDQLGTVFTSLEDILWCSVDLGACDGLLVNKIDVPHHIDVRDLCEEFGVGKGVGYALEAIRGTVAQHPAIRFVVWDTVSELDKLWLADLESQYGDEDGRWLYRKLLSHHRHHHGRLHKMAGTARPIFLAHSAAVAEPPKDAPKSVELQRRATRLPGGAEIRLAVTGQGHDIYINNASLVLTIRLEEQKGKPPKRIVCVGDTNFEVKNRMQGLIGDREEFDLLALVNRVQNRFEEVGRAKVNNP